jgi:hypothetical protein
MVDSDAEWSRLAPTGLKRDDRNQAGSNRELVFTDDARRALGHLQAAVSEVLQALAEPAYRANEIAAA